MNCTQCLLCHKAKKSVVVLLTEVSLKAKPGINLEKPVSISRALDFQKALRPVHENKL